MKHPLRENMEVVASNDRSSICCSRCHFQYCGAEQDWREFSKVRLLAPSNAGRLMGLLDGQYLMRQFYCPSCAVLVDTDFLETEPKEVVKRDAVPQECPNRPEPVALKLDGKTTVVLVLDLSARCEEPKEVCSLLMEPVGKFLARAREAQVPVIYTVSAAGKGTVLGEVAQPLKRKATEPVLSPDAFDKFMGGELKTELDKHLCRSLVIVGSATNFAVLYTATTAARVHRYEVVIPLDGVNAKGQYEHEYALHQLTILPAAANKQFRFTKLKMIEFA